MIIQAPDGTQTLFSGASPAMINNHTRPAPPGEPGASPTPVPVPQILGWDGSAKVMWERQPDGQTWHAFGLEEMIPSMDGWRIWNVSDMNDEGIIVGRAEFKDPQNPQAQAEEHGYMLVPIELRDINDPSNPGDDERITPWDTTQNIANKNIAWIDAHISDQNPAPRMPQLEFQMAGLREGFTVEAKLEVKYSRGNGKRTGRNQPEDTVKIPNDGSFKQLTDDTWQIWSEYQEIDFFGGDATLTYRVKSGSTEILPASTIDFRIGGRNPEDDKCKAYIQAQPDAGPGGSLWFAYAIARHESKGKNTSAGTDLYNQFYELPVHVKDVGRPTWNDDGSGLPGGYGVFQITGGPTDATANIPRKEIWNWQENVAAFFAIMNNPIKKELADRFNATQRGTNSQAYDQCPAPNQSIRYGSRDFPSDEAIWITSYNGWAQIAGENIYDRYVFTPGNPCPSNSTAIKQSGFRWFWNPPTKASGKKYLQLVEEEI
jgi:hypothetical protein